MKRFIVFAAALLLAAPAAAADGSFYAGASGGSTKAGAFCDGTAGLGIACDDTASGHRLFAGFGNRQAALELGYFDLGKVGGSFGPNTVSVAADGFDVSGVFGVPLGRAASIYTRLGLYHASSKVSSNFGFGMSASNTDLTFGVGFRFDPSERVALRLEWQRYNGVGDASIGESEVDMLSAGVLVSF